MNIPPQLAPNSRPSREAITQDSAADPWDRSTDASFDLRSKLAFVAAMKTRRRKQRAIVTWFMLTALMTTAATGCVWTQ